MAVAVAGNDTKRDVETQLAEFYEDSLTIISACIDNSVTTRHSSSDQRLPPVPETKLLKDYQKRIVKLVNGRIVENPYFFHSTCEELDITATTLNIKLYQVWQGIFSDGVINWGRITMFLAFNQYICYYLLSQELPSSITESITHWATSFICSRLLKDWIITNGGWVSTITCYCMFYYV